MVLEPSKLDALPIKILHRLASVGTCEALALSKARRALRLACDHRLVYKAILDNCNGNRDPKWQHGLPSSTIYGVPGLIVGALRTS